MGRSVAHEQALENRVTPEQALNRAGMALSAACGEEVGVEGKVFRAKTPRLSLAEPAAEFQTTEYDVDVTTEIWVTT